MNAFDSSILTFLNQFAHRWYPLDGAMYYAATYNLVKGGVIAAALWWIWFDRHQEQPRKQEILVSTLAASAVAILLARALALSLPFRTRPLYNADLAFQHPFNVEYLDLEAWSSFPSDHVTLFFALAIGIFLCSRAMGVLAFLHAFFVITLPRVYLGIHAPTDVIVGALMGSLIAYLFTRPRAREVINRLPIQWMHKHPGSFYACFFLLSWQVATLFQAIREILHSRSAITQLLYVGGSYFQQILRSMR